MESKRQVITIPLYIRRVQLSKARNYKFYEKGKVLPKAEKYKDRTKFEFQERKTFGKKSFLVDLATGDRVIANPKAAGTPNISVINGQKLYNGEIGKHTRSKIMMEIKNSFEPYVNQLLEITKFPIKITLEIHDVIKEGESGQLWDIDNRSMPYIKAFQDCLTGNRGNCKQIIPDDNILFVSSSPAPKFIPVNSHEDRKLVFIIEEEDDKRIIENQLYIQAQLDFTQNANTTRLSSGSK